MTNEKYKHALRMLDAASNELSDTCKPKKEQRKGLLTRKALERLCEFWAAQCMKLNAEMQAGKNL